MAQFPTFPDFFRALWECGAYDWQNGIAERIAKIANDDAPPVIAAPTAAGKTALIDAWLWALAKNLNEGEPRHVPLRLFFVVDRRLVVDGAFERAEKIKERLTAGKSPAEKAVADVLRDSGGALSLDVVRMRGGTEWDRRMWCKSPARPMIVCATVDQVGSRLLFRGYGVSARQRAIQAGLIGVDALMILDEAHLSAAFSQTLDDCRHFGGGEKKIASLQVIEMTATPRGGGDALVAPVDDIPHLSDSKRSMKNVALGSGGAPKASSLAKAAKTAIAELKKKKIPAPVVAVIANTVALARETRAAALKEGDEFDVVLLTGRSRPRTRDALVNEYKSRLLVGPYRRDYSRIDYPAKPLIVAATQCIEAGADFDFDYMITECAPLDVLRQRFGRVDRKGEMAALTGADEIRGKIIGQRALKFYGGATKETRKWLEDKVAKDGIVNFAPNEMAKKIDEAGYDKAQKMTSPTEKPPFLSPPLLEQLERTAGDSGIIPHLLHGRRDVAEVFLFWRADLPPFERAAEGDAEKEIARRLGWLPPQSEEMLSLPLWAAREWLNGNSAASMSDVDGAEADNRGDPQELRLAARIKYDDGKKIRAEILKGGDAVRAGDKLALQSESGGCDKFGWNPDSVAKVDDIAKDSEGRVIRLHRRVCPAAAKRLDAAAAATDAESFLKANAAEIAKEAGVNSNKLQEWRKHADKVVVHFYDDENFNEGVWLELPEKVGRKKSGGKISLQVHSSTVAKAVADFARAVGLPDDLIADLEKAAWWHDAGKAERRFQYGFGGSPEAPLARNGDLSDGEIRRRRNIADIKPGERHEFWSAALAEDAIQKSALQASRDSRHLILWLIATHHGNARVLPEPPREAPPEGEPQKITVTLDGKTGEADKPNVILDPAFGWAEIWRENRRRFGVWGLAYLEALLRLADMQTAQREENEK